MPCRGLCRADSSLAKPGRGPRPSFQAAGSFSAVVVSTYEACIAPKGVAVASSLGGGARGPEHNKTCSAAFQSCSASVGVFRGVSIFWARWRTVKHNEQSRKTLETIKRFWV
eukprot:13647164-Alexandrium_andersonii.AAC.1